MDELKKYLSSFRAPKLKTANEFFRTFKEICDYAKSDNMLVWYFQPKYETMIIKFLYQLRDNVQIFENEKVDGFSFTAINMITATYNCDIIYMETEDLLNFDTNMYERLVEADIKSGYHIYLTYNDVKIGVISILYKDKVILDNDALSYIKGKSKLIGKYIYELVKN
jgi:hypothetical protein